MVPTSPITAKSGHGVIFKHGEEVFIVPAEESGQPVGFSWETSAASCLPW